MTLNPLAIILSFWTWIWGPVGGLISLPLLIMFKVICDHSPAFRVVGALIGSPLVRDRVPEDADTKAKSAPSTEAEPDLALLSLPEALLADLPQTPAKPEAA